MAKLIGFTAISAEAFITAYKWMLEEGTCCLAYGDWTERAESLLLTPEQRQYRLDICLGRKEPADFSGDDVWGMIDCELIEAMVMLPVLKMVDTPSLYWDTRTGQIAEKPFFGAEFGIDLSEEFPTKAIKLESISELMKYCAGESADRVVNVHVAITSEDGPDQQFNWKVATAYDYNALEAMLDGAMTTAQDEGIIINCSFEVK